MLSQIAMQWLRKRGRGPHHRWTVIVGLCAAAVALVLSKTPALERWELYSQDTRLSLRGPRKTSAKIVIVSIEDSTLDQWVEPEIFWGHHYANIVRNSVRLGVRCVAFDIIPSISAD